MAGYKDLLGPMLQMFGQDPEEQVQNIQALLGEMKGANSANKAVAGYTPMMMNMFQQMMQQRGAGGGGGRSGASPAIAPQMRMPSDLTPQMAQSLLQSIRGL